MRRLFEELVSLVVALFVVLLIGLGLAFLLIPNLHFVKKPTPDQLYGCTPEQEAPNGECR